MGFISTGLLEEEISLLGMRKSRSKHIRLLYESNFIASVHVVTVQMFFKAGKSV